MKYINEYERCQAAIGYILDICKEMRARGEYKKVEDDELFDEIIYEYKLPKFTVSIEHGGGFFIEDNLDDDLSIALGYNTVKDSEVKKDGINIPYYWLQIDDKSITLCPDGELIGFLELQEEFEERGVSSNNMQTMLKQYKESLEKEEIPDSMIEEKEIKEETIEDVQNSIRLYDNILQTARERSKKIGKTDDFELGEGIIRNPEGIVEHYEFDIDNSTGQEIPIKTYTYQAKKSNTIAKEETITDDELEEQLKAINKSNEAKKKELNNLRRMELLEKIKQAQEEGKQLDTQIKEAKEKMSYRGE